MFNVYCVILLAILINILYQETAVSAVCRNVVVLNWYFIIEGMIYMHGLLQQFGEVK